MYVQPLVTGAWLAEQALATLLEQFDGSYDAVPPAKPWDLAPDPAYTPVYEEIRHAIERATWRAAILLVEEQFYQLQLHLAGGQADRLEPPLIPRRTAPAAPTEPALIAEDDPPPRYVAELRSV